MHLALHVLGIARLRHHQVVDALLRSIRLRRVVANMIRLVSRLVLRGHEGAIEAARLIQLVSHEDVRRRTGRHLVLHERVVCTSVFKRTIVSLDIDVADRVSLGE